MAKRTFKNSRALAAAAAVTMTLGMPISLITAHADDNNSGDASTSTTSVQALITNFQSQYQTNATLETQLKAQAQASNSNTNGVSSLLITLIQARLNQVDQEITQLYAQEQTVAGQVAASSTTSTTSTTSSTTSSTTDQTKAQLDALISQRTQIIDALKTAWVQLVTQTNVNIHGNGKLHAGPGLSINLKDVAQANAQGDDNQGDHGDHGHGRGHGHGRDHGHAAEHSGISLNVQSLVRAKGAVVHGAASGQVQTFLQTIHTLVTELVQVQQQIHQLQHPGPQPKGEDDSEHKNPQLEQLVKLQSNILELQKLAVMDLNLWLRLEGKTAVLPGAGGSSGSGSSGSGSSGGTTQPGAGVASQLVLNGALPTTLTVGQSTAPTLTDVPEDVYNHVVNGDVLRVTTSNQNVIALAGPDTLGGNTETLAAGNYTLPQLIAKGAGSATITVTDLTSTNHPSATYNIAVTTAAAPILNSAKVTSSNTVTLTFDNSLTTSRVPLASDFVVNWGTGSASPSAVTVSGNTVTLTLASSWLAKGQTIAISYNASADASNSLLGLYGGNVAAFTNVIAQNNLQ